MYTQRLAELLPQLFALLPLLWPGLAAIYGVRWWQRQLDQHGST